MIRWLKRRYLLLRGWWRAKCGLCPLCNSSPPDDCCSVCAGYDSRLHAQGGPPSQWMRQCWIRDYKELINRKKP